MNTVAPAPGHTPTPHQGPVDWRRLVEWARADGLITREEAQRTVARCAQAESVQHPLVRLASVSMIRASDGKPLDIESLTQWLAGRAGLEYLRIDPLKVDVGKVSETMSAVYAERHRVLPVQVTPTEVVVATAEPFMTDWVAEVERQSRRKVRRVVASPGRSCATPLSFSRWPNRFGRRRRPAAVRAVPASSNWWSWARQQAARRQ